MGGAQSGPGDFKFFARFYDCCTKYSPEIIAFPVKTHYLGLTHVVLCNYYCFELMYVIYTIVNY